MRSPQRLAFVTVCLLLASSQTRHVFAQALPEDDSAPTRATESEASEEDLDSESAPEARDDADAKTESERGSSSKLTHPEILETFEPTFPAQALEEGLTEGVVVLRVTIGTDGRVRDAEVAESVGHGFDESAREAALRYLFRPATRDGQAIATRVLLRVELRLPPTTPVPDVSVSAVAAPETITAEPSAGPPSESGASTEAVEIVVKGYTEAERMRRSAEAVQILETEEAKRHSQDLGEVLARTQGVGVQRAAGLGSDTRISMNGLTDDQIRFFLDGIPLEFMGYPFGIANIPVNLVDRIEIYRGVVPIRFGADALGGAINLQSDRDIKAGTHGAASLQVGSFGTYRMTLNGHHLDKPSGWLTRVGAFVDLAENNYPMDVEIAGEDGVREPTRVYRFHDAYRAIGGNVEVGVMNKPWADRLLLRGFVSAFDKEIQHNLLMTFNPYGDVELGNSTAGATLRYENVFSERFGVNAVAGYAYHTISYVDVGECFYNWFGQCFRERAQPGERVGRAQDQDYFEHNAFGRINFDWFALPKHVLHLSISPTYTGRSGEEHRMPNPEARDPLSAARQLVGLVSGVEYQLELLETRLENRLFFKDYLQVLQAEDPLSSGAGFRRKDRTTHRVGLGDSLRYTLLEWLYAKASYEWATRLPRPDEIFGNAFPIQPNLDLNPEVSHNVNLGVTVDSLRTSFGTLRGDVNGFLRDADQLILLIGDDQSASYQNAYSARSLGVESALGWSSPREYVALNGNATYVDFRNTSTEGGFADYQGQRIPNRPYFFATGNVRLQAQSIAAPRDEISLTWTTRYVQSFFRGWEGLGTDKLDVPEQLLHSVALTYFIEGDRADLSFSCELQNITDADAFDYFRVPKPGRAIYFKITSSL